jgi:hypothetical protein
VLFLTDGTTTASQDMHAASLLNLGYGFATLLTCSQATAELQRLCFNVDGGSDREDQ